ncbi:MAG TPA: peptidyl-prolyl cis-trans isomerase [Burkholderiaceae bacterium]|nr:peptidyl-prolyl cis-trans isomerase [Burkholderiaceae bacterium]
MIAKRWTRLVPCVLCLGAALGPLAAIAQPAPRPAATAPAASAPPTFATVGDVVVPLPDYQRALTVAVRKKFYHAKPPEGELAKFQREVGDDVVNRVLLLAEARKRGLQPDRARIDATVAGYDAQYGKSDTWKTQREKMLAAVVPQLERDSLIEQLEREARKTEPASDAALRDYYERHKALFVEPEQIKIAVILLRVAPSAPVAQWRAADEEGQRLHARLKGGADFASLARLHSGDRSATQGGQMEYTHRGMLPEAVQQVVDPLKPGEISAPVRLLEGVAILRVDGRRPAQQRAFDDVKPRAAELWQRDAGEARWKQLIAELRRATPVRIDESHYAPLPPSAPASAPTASAKPSAG